ncbi:hypothetical protein [Mesorhizobium sp. B1-1-8]|uniref:hypothetical protein n=1 Tax=Mesorhizobium sp. B1-1-8 TaxID=2589976 RepID=UPI001AEDD12B|nr:hypothetical protein [Mesorhizobium sp. B1-1-8]UCI10795.1 hypothetical protein FJ974_30040 [Mesorhizobium sp. B1-1-8]
MPRLRSLAGSRRTVSISIFYTTRPLRLHDGLAIAPDEPGVGVTFDWRKLAGFEGKHFG